MKAIKKARIFSSKDEKGRKQTVLVQGQKGKGAWICACTEGTSSVYSKRHAILYCKQIAEENDITHLFIENQFLVDDVAWVFRDGEYHIADNLGHAQKEKV